MHTCMAIKKQPVLFSVVHVLYSAAFTFTGAHGRCNISRKIR
ncbi:hypothetical protein [Pseudescherichia vulneris]